MSSIKPIITFCQFPLGEDRIVKPPMHMGEIVSWEKASMVGDGIQNYLITVKGLSGRTVVVDADAQASVTHNSWSSAYKRIREIDPTSGYLGTTIKK